MTGHVSNVNQIIKINENQVATSSNDLTIKVWNIDTNSVINTYFAHTGSVKSVTV
jgi:WD40 repeat protein